MKEFTGEESFLIGASAFRFYLEHGKVGIKNNNGLSGMIHLPTNEQLMDFIIQYYLMKATEEEKNQFQQVLDRHHEVISLTEKKIKIMDRNKMKNLFTIYIQYGKNSNEFQQFISKYIISDYVLERYFQLCFKTAKREEKDGFRNRLREDTIKSNKEVFENIKNAFYACIEANFNPILILKQAKQYQVDLQTFVSWGEEYANRYSTWEEKKAYKKHFTEIQFQYHLIANALMQTDNQEDIIRFFNDNGSLVLTIEELKKKCQHYLDQIYCFHSEENMSKIKQKLESAISFVEQKRTEEENNKILKRNEEKEINEKKAHMSALHVMNSFVRSSNRSVTQFCREHLITHQHFEKYMKMIQTTHGELYQKVLLKLEGKGLYDVNQLDVQVYTIIDLIENGVCETNGTIRPFDIIDYYIYTKMTFNQIVRYCAQHCTVTELNILKSFVFKNKSLTVLNNNCIEALLSEHFEIQPKFDSNQQLICGSGRIITCEEKQHIIDYLNHHEIPITYQTYGQAFKRYLNNQLVVDAVSNNSDVKMRK